MHPNDRAFTEGQRRFGDQLIDAFDASPHRDALARYLDSIRYSGGVLTDESFTTAWTVIALSFLDGVCDLLNKEDALHPDPAPIEPSFLSLLDVVVERYRQARGTLL